MAPNDVEISVDAIAIINQIMMSLKEVTALDYPIPEENMSRVDLDCIKILYMSYSTCLASAVLTWLSNNLLVCSRFFPKDQSGNAINQ